MSDYPDAMPHGPLEEVFPDVFFVTGTMRGEFFGSTWQFSRNMTVVREGDDLTIVNSVRLGDDGLRALAPAVMMRPIPMNTIPAVRIMHPITGMIKRMRQPAIICAVLYFHLSFISVFIIGLYRAG